MDNNVNNTNINNVNNDQINNEDNDSKKIFTMIILIITIMICTTSATYAYFALTASNNNTITGTAATHTLALTITQADLQSSNTNKMVPQLESALSTAMNSTNMCVDGNGNIVCKVYTITIENNSTAAVVVNGTIQFTAVTTVSGTDETTNLRWKRVAGINEVGSLDTEEIAAANAQTPSTTLRADLTTGGECVPGTTNDGCTGISLPATASDDTDTATFYIVVWINETGSAQTDSGTWKATVTFEGDNGTGITSTITA